MILFVSLVNPLADEMHIFAVAGGRCQYIRGALEQISVTRVEICTHVLLPKLQRPPFQRGGLFLQDEVEGGTSLLI